MLTLAFDTRVAASPRLAWRVLRRPAAAALWLPNHEGWLDAPPERFALQRSLRFRSRLRRIPVSGELRVLDVTPRRVRARLRIGLLALEARISVSAVPGSPGTARVGLLLTCANRVAHVGGSLDRVSVRKLVSELAEATLAAIAAAAETEAGTPMEAPGPTQASASTGRRSPKRVACSNA